MGQKSLSVVHRIDNSMIWSSSLYNCNYKWLSYNLWFVYTQFYKTMLFSDIYTTKIWNNFENKYDLLPTIKKKKTHINKTFIRFSYYVDLYCVEFIDFFLLINIYFHTSLNFYKTDKNNKNNKNNKLKDCFN